jgi:3-phenylpropionate/trans-cinnamate dioxygenase ferredoxin reductase subunit
VVTKKGETIDCQFLGLTVGVRPNIDFLQDSGIETARGVLVDEALRTNIDNIYAIGDCAELRTPRAGRRSVEALWYTGRMMGQTVARTICGEPTTYDPGIWFNSAKFFDLEYQVYGHAPSKLEPELDSLYWEHPNGHAAIRINFRRADRTVCGFNLLGVRYRHEICHEWIRDRQPLSFVLQHLGAANFDPEFYPQYELEIIALHNERFPATPITRHQKRGLRALFAARRATRDASRQHKRSD